MRKVYKVYLQCYRGI